MLDLYSIVIYSFLNYREEGKELTVKYCFNLKVLN